MILLSVPRLVYRKIFQSIMDSSIAADTQLRRFFMDLLVIADPEGEINATPEAIARRLNTTLEEVTWGLAELQKPDPGSRNPAEEGRRLVPLEGQGFGWRIVNFVEYLRTKNPADRRAKATDRQRRFREREAAKKTGGVTPVTLGDAGDPTKMDTDTDRKELPRRAGARPQPGKKPDSTTDACDECQRVVEHLNEKADRGYPTKNGKGEPTAGVRLIHTRHMEHDTDACLRVIDDRASRWKGDPKMDEFLRPKTLFRKHNFESYLEDLRARGTARERGANRAARMRAWDEKLHAMIQQVESEGDVELERNAIVTEAGRRLREQGITPPSSERFRP